MTAISFIVPAFNEEKYIYECVSSIRTEAIRSCKDWEIVVINNNSTDKTIDNALKCYNVSVINEKRQGLVWSRQCGFKYSKYPFIAFIDADCVMPTGWVDAAIDAFYDQENVVCVSGPLKFYDSTTFINKASTGFYKIAKQIHKKYPTVQGGNFIVKRDALEAVGGFDTDIQFYSEDTATAIRLARIGKIVLEPNMWINTSARRLQNQGLINTVATYIANYLSMHLIDRPITKKHKDYR